ncbi:hypothetical protein ACXDF8_16925 [Mycolicibacterium sp. CBM1]
MSVVGGLDGGGEVLALTEPGRFFGDILDIGRSDAVLLVVRVANDCAVIALEILPESVEAACRQAHREPSHCVSIDVAEISQLLGYGERWTATLGSQLPVSNEGVARFAVEFDSESVPTDAQSPAPAALGEMIGRNWSIDHIRPARIRRPGWSDEMEFEAPILAWLLSVHQDQR